MSVSESTFWDTQPPLAERALCSLEGALLHIPIISGTDVVGFYLSHSFFLLMTSRQPLSLKKQKSTWGAWVTQSVRCPALGFSLGHDLMVCGFQPCVGLCTDTMKPTWDPLLLPLFLPHLCCFCLSQNK